MSTIFKDRLTFGYNGESYSINDSNSDWPGAIKFGVDQLDGWDETSDINVSRTQRGVGDGDYISKIWYKKARMLTVGGYIYAADRATLESLFDLLVVNAFPENTDITLTRYEPIPKYVTARVAGKVEITQKLNAGLGLRWLSTLLCADPLKYDAEDVLTGTSGVAGVSTGGMTLPLTLPLVFNTSAQGEGNQVVVFNRGTTKAPLNVDINGPLTTGWRLDNVTTGDSMAFDIGLGVNDVLSIDTKAKSALLNGSPISGLISGSWWQLAPKSNTIRLYGTFDPAAKFTINAKSTWR